jgi:cell envelope opacity-associated protein A
VKQKTLKWIESNTYYNEYNENIIEKVYKQRKHKQNTHNDTQSQKTEWATFMYNVRETRKITKLFRDTKLKIAFCTKRHNTKYIKITTTDK